MSRDAKPPEKRGKVLIDREFQLRFISRLGGVLFFYLLVFLVISVVAPVAFTFLGDPPEWALMETAFRVEVLLRLILAPLACTFLCLFGHGVLETFRIAGPNYRYKRVFADVKELRVPRGIQTRQGDYLRDTTAAFDEALVALHDSLKDLRRDAGEAAGRVRAALAAFPGNGLSREALAAIARLEQGFARFELVGRAPQCAPIPDEHAPVEPAEARAPVELEPVGAAR